MSVDRYQILFSGQILDGFEENQVKANLQELFRATEARIERLFLPTATPVIKSDLNHQDAEIYYQKLTRAGANVRISAQPRAAAKPVVDSEANAPATADTPPPATPNAGREQPGDDDRRRAGLEFTGKGGEYFGIWIVNILLTILTLGIYSAWATVRNNQYFYGNTQLDGASFQYLASPITILKGRLIALAVLIAYVAITNLVPEAAILFVAVFLVATPWIMIRSLRFNAINSAYRNIRFDFVGSYGQAFMVTFVWPLLNLVCLLLLTPLVLKKTHQFIADNSRYGTTAFELQATTKAYYRFFGMALLMVLGFAAAAFGLMQVGQEILATLVAVAGYIALIGYFMAGVTNLFLGSTTLADHQFESELSPGKMVWIYASNVILIVLTLGLFTPWAKVRMARYRANCSAMWIAGDLDHFNAAEQNRTSAVGQELGDAFDVAFSAV
ncbi:YjgN family protein [Marinobacter sp. chi1]|uniref:YjgN family protein n=1 Tax=Marinobacter suaedae TaxID=3057675 RepID=A0ABT8VYJ6_9GAMM|nr:YjgN family protein [Marinobacter sp. chi1]MDO3721020.1 YjgN family protein [Marinobacter sp. chi1]